jgi:DNA-binding transcriptional LysR family regulator
MDLNKQLCIGAQGLTVLPDVLCEAEVKYGKLVKLLPDTPFEHPHIYAVYPSRIHPTKALTTLIEFIASELSKLESLN